MRQGQRARRAARLVTRLTPPASRPVRAGSSHGVTRDRVHRTFIPRSESFQNGGVMLAACRPAGEGGLLGAPWGCSSRRTRRHTRLIFAACSPRSPPVVWPPIPDGGPPSPAAPPRGRVGRRRARPSAPWEPARRPGPLNARPPRGWSGPGRLVRCLARSAFEEPCRSLPPSSHGASPAPADPAANASTPPTPGSSCSSTSRPRRRFHPCAEGPRHRATGTTAARWRARGRRQPGTLSSCATGWPRAGDWARFLSAATAPPPRQRRLTRPTRASDERRIGAKKRGGSGKRQRGRRDHPEE